MDLPPPLLRRVPDATKASAPLFQPFVFAYAALLFGVVAAGILAIYNAVLTRRLAHVAGVIGFAAAGLGLSMALFVGLIMAGVENPALLILGVRVIQIAAGAGMTWLGWNQFKGHLMLDGNQIDILPTYLALFVLFMLAPPELIVRCLLPMLL